MLRARLPARAVGPLRAGSRPVRVSAPLRATPFSEDLPDNESEPRGSDHENELPSSSSSSSPFSFDFAALQRKAKTLAALEAYQELMRRETIDLVEGAVLLAQHRYPDLTLREVEEKLDALAAEFKARIPEGNRYPSFIVQRLLEFFEEKGFEKNEEDYYNVENSCINAVLEKKKGIPISLSLILMEIGRRSGLVEFIGLNIPAHFLIRPKTEEVEFLVDAYYKEILFLEDAEARLSKLWGGAQVKLDPKWLELDSAISPRLFLGRMTNNIKGVYVMNKNHEDALQLTEYLIATYPTLTTELRDKGVLLYYLDRVPEAIETLELYLLTAPKDKAAIEGFIQQIKLKGRPASN